MRDVEGFIDKAHEIYGYDHFLNDAGGSICELPDGEAMRVLREHTLILYLRAGPEMEEDLIRRAAANPKPLYFGERFLDKKLAEYLAETGLPGADAIEPDRFVQWIFPRLLEHRRPRYAAIADAHGYTVDAREIARLEGEDDFIELIAAAIDRKHEGMR